MMKAITKQILGNLSLSHTHIHVRTLMHTHKQTHPKRPCMTDFNPFLTNQVYK